MFIDTHAHLNIMVNKEPEAILNDTQLLTIGSLIQESKDNGIEKIVNIGTSYNESFNSVLISKKYKSVFAAVGIHPTDCYENWRSEFEKIEELVARKSENKIVAIGETGLDFFHKPFDKERQIDSFIAHIELAIKSDLPLVIHVREAADETLKVLEKYKGKIRGVNHCFVHSLEFAKTIMSWGLFIGIDAPITYPKNEGLRNTLKALPLEFMVLETDSPFLPPQQYRGKQNHPKYIPLFAQELADLKGVSLLDLAIITTTNAKKLFGFLN